MILNKYETVIIVDNTFTEDDVKAKVIAKYKDIIYEYGRPIEDKLTTVMEITILGKKKLAYTIKEHDYGWFIQIIFWAQSEDIKELERLFRINDDIIKFIVVKITGDIPGEVCEYKLDESEQKKSDADTTTPTPIHNSLGSNHYDYLFGYTDILNT